MVICSEVIEHLADKEGFLHEINRILKDGGYLILTTPNPDALIYFIPKLLSKIFKQYQLGAPHVFNELLKTSTLLTLLAKTNFEVVYRSGLVLNFYTNNLIEQFFRTPSPLRRILERLERIFVNLTLYQVVLARK